MGYWSKNSEWLRSVKEMSLILRCLALTALAFILPAQTTSSAIAKPYYEDPEGYEIYAALLAAPNPNKGGSDLAVILQRTLVFENCYKPDEQWRELLAPVLENYEKMNQTRWNLADSLFRFPHKLISADEEYALFAKGTKNGWNSSIANTLIKHYCRFQQSGSIVRRLLLWLQLSLIVVLCVEAEEYLFFVKLMACGRSSIRPGQSVLLCTRLGVGRYLSAISSDFLIHVYLLKSA